MLTAVTGVNWGDEGKGRVVDLVSRDYDIVVRYQGGNNAGHTVVIGQERFVLNLLPSGILRPEVVNVMGNGMVIDLEHLSRETMRLRGRGVHIGPDNLKISDRAVVCLPFHPLMDKLEEERLGMAAVGSTRLGIAPAYGDKYMRRAIRMGDLLHLHRLKDGLKRLVDFKNLVLDCVYGAPKLDFEEVWGWVECMGAEFTPYVCDTGLYLDEAAHQRKNILLEAQFGALRDVDFGMYPYTTSSNTIAAYAPIGAGIPNWKLDRSIGVMKAYSTSLGGGHLVAELSPDEGAALLEKEHNTFTAGERAPHVGPFDAVAARYGCRMQGADEVALTMLDVLSGESELAMCVSYDIDGTPTDDFPYGYALEKAKPVYRRFKGWKKDISGIRRWQDLPKEAMEYVTCIEKSVGVPVTLVSVGPDREAYIDFRR